jgi:tetratricopeptide (TPR) repeat protein
MKPTWKSLTAVLAIAVLALMAAGCQKLKARDQLNKGVQAYRSAKYPEAVEFFKRAIQLDPEFPTAKLYLATAYMMQYIPGAESPENLQMAQAAHDTFLEVLKANPKDTVAIASIASLYFNQKKFDEAEEWNRKLIQVDPKNKDAFYTLGVIAWTKAFQVNAEARAKLGMRPEDPGPLKDKKVREEIKARQWNQIEQGIKDLEKALELDREYDEAMAYLNLLFRQRADLEDTPEAYKKDTEIADTWIQRTLETKKAKAARAPAAQGITQETR